MQVFVKTLGGEIYTVEIDHDGTFGQIKQQIYIKHKIPVDEQSLIYFGKVKMDSEKAFETQYDGPVHLFRKLNNVFDNKFNPDEMELVWTVNYFAKEDTAFPTETYLLNAASDDVSIAYESFLKRHKDEGNKQVVYLALTAIKKSDLIKFNISAVTPKYRPASGRELKEYLSLDTAIPIRTLMVAGLNENGDFYLLQDSDKKICSSAWYQEKLHDLRPELTSLANQSVAKEIKKHDIKDALNLEEHWFQTMKNLLINEINTYIPDDGDEEELLELKTGLEEFLKRLVNLKALPLGVSKDPSLVNILSAILNDKRIMSDKISDQKRISYTRQFIEEQLNTLNKLVVDDTNAPIIQQSQTTLKKEDCYLMFDVGGVLDGSYVDNKKDIANDDLVLKKHEYGGFQVLKKGVQIIKGINQLINQYNYKMLLHSKNFEKDQLEQINELRQACDKKDIKFPRIEGMAVYDNKNFAAVSSSAPHVSKTDCGITVVGWGRDDLDGKASVRQALGKTFGFKPGPNHFVFDDGPSIIVSATQEGYTAYEINDANQPLYTAVDKALTKAKGNETVLSSKTSFWSSSSQQETKQNNANDNNKNDDDKCIIC